MGAVGGVVYGALGPPDRFQPLLRICAPVAVAAAVLASWGALRRRSGLTIGVDGLMYQRGLHDQQFEWSQIEQVEALNVAPGFSSIHITVRGEATTLSLAPDTVIGGTNRALAEIRRFVELAHADVQIIDNRLNDQASR